MIASGQTNIGHAAGRRTGFPIDQCGAAGQILKMIRLLMLLLGLSFSQAALADDGLAELRKRAEQNDAVAQKDLGIRYANGTGVPKDSSEAAKWLRKAAEQGNVPAQKNLGLMYANGTGVAKDPVEAVKWFRKAAEKGYPKALFRLGEAYDNGAGVPKDHAEAMKWYRKAAEQAEAATLTYLGQMHAKGTGVPQDLIYAHVWLSIGIAKGDESGRAMLTIVQDKMTAAQRTTAIQTARELYQRMPEK